MTLTPKALRDLLGPRVRCPLPAEGRREAAVLVALLWRRRRPHVLLTRRTEHVRNHPGQIAFPGGHCEPGDRDAVATALRETHEEIGLAPKAVEVIGLLDDFHTLTTRYHLTPIVGIVHRAPKAWAPHEGEVAAVLEVPLAHLLDPASRTEHVAGAVVSPAFAWKGHIIWGATARILIALLDLIG